MNAAEHVVKLWLEAKGFFVMGPLRVGAQELDMVAVRLDTDKKSVLQKVHVEVTVSGRPGGPDDGTGVAEYAIRKFGGKIGVRVQELLGAEYERWLVLGKVVKGQEQKWELDGPQHGVSVIPFTRVVKEYIEALPNAPADELGRLLDTFKCVGLL